jgi:uncharacterized protein (TIGR00725 family)
VVSVRTIIGVMGGGEADDATQDLAYRMGAAIAERGWVLLNGGRDCGVMDASARGARDVGGLVVGILPDADTRQASSHVDIPIVTDLGYGRNYVNVLSSRVVVALPGRAGTLSEIALALSIKRPVVLVGFDPGTSFAEFRQSGLLRTAESPEMAVALIAEILGEEVSP